MTTPVLTSPSMEWQWHMLLSKERGLAVYDSVGDNLPEWNLTLDKIMDDEIEHLFSKMSAHGLESTELWPLYDVLVRVFIAQIFALRIELIRRNS